MSDTRFNIYEPLSEKRMMEPAPLIEYWEVEVLSPLHIGSGEELLMGLELMPVKVKKEPWLGVLNAEKVFAAALRGSTAISHKKSLIDTWMRGIEEYNSGQSDLAFLSGYLTADMLPQVCDRFIQPGEVPVARLKAFVQNGHGLSLLPGSSVKGAIRTALLPHAIRQLSPGDWPVTVIPEKGRPNDTALLKLFGKDPNFNLMRFLQVGDGCFAPGSTRSLHVNVMNLIHFGDPEKWQTDNQKGKGHSRNVLDHFVEAVNEQMRTVLRVVQWPGAMKELKGDETAWLSKTGLADLWGQTDRLFRILNAQSAAWVQRELAFCRDSRRGNLDEVYAFEEPLEFLEQAIAEAQARGEAVLRMSYGSGYPAITGGFQEEYFGTGKWEQVLPRLKKHNGKEGRAVQPHYPKTRRFTAQGQPLGFVKLRRVSVEDWKAHQQKLAEAQQKLNAVAGPPPDYFSGKLRRDEKVPARYLRCDAVNRARKTFLLLIRDEAHSQEFACNYNAELEPGQKVRFKVTRVENGKVVGAEFAGMM